MNGRVGMRVGNSIDERIMRFFTENPDEELNYADLEVKFAASRRTIHCAVWRLSARGLLESVRIVRLSSPSASRGSAETEETPCTPGLTAQTQAQC